MANILIVDDELSLREYLGIFLRKLGHQATLIGDARGAIALGERQDFDLILCDLCIGDQSGLDVLRAFKANQPATEVIIVTAFATVENALEAMRLGAYDYVTKPFKNQELALLIDRALEKRELSRENESLKIQLSASARQHRRDLVGESPSMREVQALIDKVAQSRTNVLVVGESGVGKELVARALHHQSPRARGPFVPINCGAIPEGLIESELFGHVRGAFTGAMGDRSGLFKAAQGGTLFFDEVGELPLSAQVKLLRALQERRIRPVGGVRDIEIDVRLVAATNRNLALEVREGRFREDLFYRLNVIQICVPPLRERQEDIVPLARNFVEQNARELGIAVPVLSEAVVTQLCRYGWPGNVRELQNAMERAVTLCEGGRIEIDTLPATVRGEAVRFEDKLRLDLPAEGLDLESHLEGLERHLLLEALARTGGNRTHAAKLLGLSFRSMRYRMAKLGLNEGRDEGI